jgi:hypothetical protein
VVLQDCVDFASKASKNQKQDWKSPLYSGRIVPRLSELNERGESNWLKIENPAEQWEYTL